MFIPTDRIELRKGFETSEKKHLSYNNDTVVLFCENLFADVQKATEKIIHMINNDKIKLKKISAGYYE